MTLITRPFIAPTGPLSLTNIMAEKQSGLSSIFSIKCGFCSHENEVKSSAEHRAGSCGPLVSNINTRAVLGSLHAGMGNTHLNNLLSTMNVLTMNHNLFKRREREVGNALEKVATDSCKFNLDFKKKLLRNLLVYLQTVSLPGVAVSYNMGWKKRGRGHNSATGQGAAMGLATGKVLTYSTKCKMC